MSISAHHSLHDHVALVTGANHGIGAATAVALATRGAAVLAAYFSIPDAHDAGTPRAVRDGWARDASAVVERIRAAGGSAEAVSADLADPDSARVLFDAAESAFGPVDVLVNNASAWIPDSFAAGDRGRHVSGAALREVTAGTFDRQFAVDARGSALLMAEFARRHIARGAQWGRIVSMTSGGPDGFPSEVSYGAAKAALVNYTMSAARELAPYGVTANAVHPPVTDTGWITDEVREFVAGSSDHFHVADPREVAEVICWLAGESAYLVTGNVLHLR